MSSYILALASEPRAWAAESQDTVRNPNEAAHVSTLHQYMGTGPNPGGGPHLEGESGSMLQVASSWQARALVASLKGLPQAAGLVVAAGMRRGASLGVVAAAVGMRRGVGIGLMGVAKRALALLSAAAGARGPGAASMAGFGLRMGAGAAGAMPAGAGPVRHHVEVLAIALVRCFAAGVSHWWLVRAPAACSVAQARVLGVNIA